MRNIEQCLLFLWEPYVFFVAKRFRLCEVLSGSKINNEVIHRIVKYNNNYKNQSGNQTQRNFIGSTCFNLVMQLTNLILCYESN
jgi:hypothetical protein